MRYQLDAFDEPIEIPTRTPRTLEGAPSMVAVRYFANFVGTTVVDRPPAYVVPAEVAAHLARPRPGQRAGDRRAARSRSRPSSGSAPRAGARSSRRPRSATSRSSWQREVRALPAGARIVRTDSPLGAIAVYLCEPESDDGAIENGLVGAPAVGDEFPIWRAW